MLVQCNDQLSYVDIALPDKEHTLFHKRSISTYPARVLLT